MHIGFSFDQGYKRTHLAKVLAEGMGAKKHRLNQNPKPYATLLTKTYYNSKQEHTPKKEPLFSNFLLTQKGIGVLLDP